MNKIINKKIIFIFLTGFLILVASLVFIKINNKLKSPRFPKKEIIPTITPTPTVLLEEPPSLYATDAAILKIEEEINQLEKELNQTDLKEKQLNPPLLDWNVSYEEK
ncbi:MAG: hypothetical protein ACPLKP_00530 [Microgenomates group bacterium]